MKAPALGQAGPKEQARIEMGACRNCGGPVRVMVPMLAIEACVREPCPRCRRLILDGVPIVPPAERMAA